MKNVLVFVFLFAYTNITFSNEMPTCKGSHKDRMDELVKFYSYVLDYSNTHESFPELLGSGYDEFMSNAPVKYKNTYWYAENGFGGNLANGRGGYVCNIRSKQGEIIESDSCGFYLQTGKIYCDGFKVPPKIEWNSKPLGKKAPIQ